MRTLQSTKRFANQRESVFPGDRLVFVGLGVVEQRLSEPTYCFEVVVGSTSASSLTVWAAKKSRSAFAG